MRHNIGHSTQGIEKANYTTCKMKPLGQKAWLVSGAWQHSNMFSALLLPIYKHQLLF